MERRVESKRCFVGHPTGRFGLECVLQIRPDVEITRAWSTAEPLHRAAGGEVGIEVFDIERDGAGRLIRVKHDHRAYFMRAIDDGFCVLKKRALEKHVREGNEQRRL